LLNCFIRKVRISESVCQPCSDKSILLMSILGSNSLNVLVIWTSGRLAIKDRKGKRSLCRGTTSYSQDLALNFWVETLVKTIDED
jgi:hypothetical protein